MGNGGKKQLNGTGSFKGVSRIVIERRYLPTPDGEGEGYGGVANQDRVAAIKERLETRKNVKKLSRRDSDIVTIVCQYLKKLKMT